VNSLSRIPPSLAEPPDHGNPLSYWASTNSRSEPEFVRKTQLETDQIAARQIQQTLQPGKLEELPGYELESFYKPLQEVGGDYFDVIELPANRTLLALADVSGKGISAALLAANIQALVRSIASVESTRWHWPSRLTSI